MIYSSSDEDESTNVEATTDVINAEEAVLTEVINAEEAVPTEVINAETINVINVETINAEAIDNNQNTGSIKDVI